MGQLDTLDRSEQSEVDVAANIKDQIDVIVAKSEANAKPKVEVDLVTSQMRDLWKGVEMITGGLHTRDEAIQIRDMELKDPVRFA